MKRRAWPVFAVAALMIGVTAVLLVRLRMSQQLGQPGVKVSAIEGTNQMQIDLPLAMRGCTLERVEPNRLEIEILPKDTTMGKRYFQFPDGFAALLSVVLMGTDRTSIHKPQFCLTGQGWKIDRTEPVRIAMTKPHGYDLPAMRLTVSKPVPTGQGRGQTIRGIYVYWFVAEDRLTSQHWERMWWMASELLQRGVLQRWAYVSYFSVCQPGQEEATYQRLRSLVQETVPLFQQATGDSKARARGEDLAPRSPGAGLPGTPAAVGARF